MLVADVSEGMVLLAAAVYFVLGALWYSPVLFSKPWMKAVGKTEAELKEGSNGRAYATTFVLIAILCYVLAHMLEFTQASTIGEGLATAWWLWFGFVATTMAINGIFSGRPRQLALIDSGYHLAGMLIAAVILVL